MFTPSRFQRAIHSLSSFTGFLASTATARCCSTPISAVNRFTDRINSYPSVEELSTNLSVGEHHQQNSLHTATSTSKNSLNTNNELVFDLFPEEQNSQAIQVNTFSYYCKMMKNEKSLKSYHPQEFTQLCALLWNQLKESDKKKWKIQATKAAVLEQFVERTSSSKTSTVSSNNNNNAILTRRKQQQEQQQPLSLVKKIASSSPQTVQQKKIPQQQQQQQQLVGNIGKQQQHQFVTLASFFNQHYHSVKHIPDLNQRVATLQALFRAEQVADLQRMKSEKTSTENLFLDREEKSTIKLQQQQQKKKQQKVFADSSSLLVNDDLSSQTNFSDFLGAGANVLGSNSRQRTDDAQ
jgi:hypothetical protein